MKPLGEMPSPALPNGWELREAPFVGSCAPRMTQCQTRFPRRSPVTEMPALTASDEDPSAFLGLQRLVGRRAVPTSNYGKRERTHRNPVYWYNEFGDIP